MAAPAPMADTSRHMDISDGAIARRDPRDREKELTRSPWYGLLAIAAVTLVGWIDWLTGLDIGFSLFYLLPIAWAGLRLGRIWVAATALTAAASWLLAELAWHDLGAGPMVWNGFTRLVIYSLVGGMLVVLREDRIELETLNRKLSDSLEAQTRLARTDLLTGLPNARWFLEELARRIAAQDDPGGKLCLLYVDVDNFKDLNDHYGHSAGDRALREIADVLRSCVRSGEAYGAPREDDLAARLGGDEFAILLAGVDPEGAMTIAERIIGRISDLAGVYPTADLGASIGISCARISGEDPEDLIRRADRAMYRSKAAGKGKVTVEASEQLSP